MLSTGGRLFGSLRASSTRPFGRSPANAAAPARKVQRLTTAPAGAEHLDIAAKNTRKAEESSIWDSAYQGVTGCVFFTQHLAEIGQTGL